MEEVELLFYHFTPPANLMFIAAEGIIPAARGNHGLMTDGVPVVWLTTQPTRFLTSEDVTFLNLRGAQEIFGKSAFGGDGCVRVNLDLNNRRLKRYFDIATPAAIAPCAPSARNWYVYYGTISPQRLSIHAGEMVKCFEAQMTASASDKVRLNFEALRDEVASLPSDQPVTIVYDPDMID